ncbi:MAG TPA: Trm112 family protein [Thermodesulfobacteriota bacterium]|nr:Trm112 family protein [Thermodesulfobacteriota bacterium]
MSLDEKLLEILACPKCKGGIRYSEDRTGLVCDRCKLLYPIKDGIPIMLIGEAKRLENAGG